MHPLMYSPLCLLSKTSYLKVQFRIIQKCIFISFIQIAFTENIVALIEIGRDVNNDLACVVNHLSHCGECHLILCVGSPSE